MNEKIDLSGLNCPLPILKTKQKLLSLDVGDILEVITTDPHSEIDFKVFVEKSGHELISFQTINESFIFVIKKLK